MSFIDQIVADAQAVFPTNPAEAIRHAAASSLVAYGSKTTQERETIMNEAVAVTSRYVVIEGDLDKGISKVYGVFTEKEATDKVKTLSKSTDRRVAGFKTPAGKSVVVKIDVDTRGIQLVTDAYGETPTGSSYYQVTSTPTQVAFNATGKVDVSSHAEAMVVS